MPELPPTQRRVQQNTPDGLNEQIRQKTRDNIERYRNAGQIAIRQRLLELAQEWDTERVLEANASALVMIGSALGFFVSRWWLILSFVVGAFLFQHALQGWCPPLPLIRALGVRTTSEINAERDALTESLDNTGG
jgi:hypothetical protein